MNRILGTIAIALLSTLTLAQAGPGRSETPFHQDGAVRLDLSAGDWTVRAGVSDKIVVTLHAGSSDVRRIRVKVEVKGSNATVTVRETPDNDFSGEIELPARTDLGVWLTAGDLKIKGIEGNKDVHNHAGDVDIEVRNADDYGRVDLSVLAGDITAQPFEKSTGGLFRHLQHSGSGPYSLRAHIDAGDLRVVQRKHESML
jgi:hypothetical protein